MIANVPPMMAGVSQDGSAFIGVDARHVRRPRLAFGALLVEERTVR